MGAGLRAADVDDAPADEAMATAHGLPQAAHVRRARAQAQAAIPEPHSQVSQQIAVSTLREEDAETTRQMIRVGRGLGVAAVAVMPFAGGSTPVRIVLAVAIAVAVAAGLWFEGELRRRRTASHTQQLWLGLWSYPSIQIGMVYFGTLSAAQLLPALALYFFSRRERRSSAITLYVLNAVTQGALAIVFTTGLVEDPGLVVPHLPWPAVVAGYTLLQLAFFGAFLLGRGAHQASRDAIDKMQNALQLVAQREALLAEARQDLDRALAIDVAGAFTGHTFAGYRAGNVIGRGGMGEVYEATHVETGAHAAIKLLGRRELANPASVERFGRETRACRGLRSPYVVRVLATSEDGDPIPFLVMERLRGHDLAHHLREGQPSADGLLELLAQVGDAVEEAWTNGVVHRDLKPQNLFLADGTWKVLDFGVAALDEHSGTLTQGQIVGTPTYMAPEQARGERVDHRADVYALAAIAYRWLTGRPVCAGKDLHQALYEAVHVMPQPPSTLVALPADVDAALALGLAKDPRDRLESCHDLRTALAHALAGELDDATRTRARALLAKHPWGTARA